MQVTRYQILSMISDSYLESAQLHLDLAKVYQEERNALSIEDAEKLIDINEMELTEDTLHRLAEKEDY